MLSFERIGIGENFVIEIQFEDLEKAELIKDCVYKGGTAKNIFDDVLPRLLPKCGKSS